MKTATLNRVWQLASRTQVLRAGIAIMTAFWLLSANHLLAGTTVSWVTGGPLAPGASGTGYGNVDGDITTAALYHTPFGMVMDSTGNTLYLADRDNNTVRKLNFSNNRASTLVTLTNIYTAPTTNLIKQPVGVALDLAGNLYVLNRGNGTDGNVLKFQLRSGSSALLIATNLTKLTNAAGIALDFYGNIYVTASNRVIRVATNGVSDVVATITNPGASLQGIVVKHNNTGINNGFLAVCDSGRHCILLINPATSIVTTNAGFLGIPGDFATWEDNNFSPSETARFFNPAGIAETGDGTLIVADRGNHRVKAVFADGSVTNLYGVTTNDWVLPSMGWPGFTDLDGGVVIVPDMPGGVSAREPNGVILAPNGDVYVTEDYYHIIRKVPVTSTGLIPPLPPPPAAPIIQSITAKYVTLVNGQVTLTWSAVGSATNYIVKRSQTSGSETPIANTGLATSYTDTNVINGNTYYYVVSAVNAGGEGPNSWEISTVVPLPPVPDPQIGYVEFPPPDFSSVFHAVSASGAIFNNDKPIVIIGAAQSQTFYNYANTATVTNVPDPTPLSASAPVGYVDGLYSVAGLTVAEILPNVSIKAIGMQTNHPPSAVVSALFQFVTANPVINGANAALFTISDVTANAHLYYTLDGSDPSSTNANAVDLGTVATPTNVWTVSLNIQSNTWFKVRAFKNNYQPSAIVSQQFTTAGFQPNTITFGQPVGEPHSSFIARPGQFFYAPVTLQLTPGFGKMYSLQFNASVTNGIAYNVTNVLVHTNSTINFTNAIALSTNISVITNLFVFKYDSTQTQVITNLWFNTNTIIVATNGSKYTNIVLLPNDLVYTNSTSMPPAIQNGAGIDFASMLMTQVQPSEGQYFPPANGQWYLSIPALTPNISGGGTNFVPSSFVNTNNNLLGIGWFYRTGFKYGPVSDINGVVYLDFDTTKQDLIAYSIAHDTLFGKGDGTVIVGAYSFQVPTNASIGDKYFIQLGSPSATADGVGAPGASIYIKPPDASQAVTVGSPGYLVGDAAPFHWFNSGDFGNTNLDNSDVMQVYQSGILVDANGKGVNMPPTNSDLFLAMDSSGGYGEWDSVNGYYTNSGPASLPAQQAMWDGNDLTINTNMFGDGVLDINDIFVTFRRSLDPSLTWFKRYWTNNQFVAVTTPNLAFNSNSPHLSSHATLSANISSAGDYRQSSINFSAGDAVVTTNLTIQIPINAQIFGSYPLRVLGLCLTVVPLDGSPAITTPVTFTPVAGLGSPTITSSKGAATYSAAWLDSGISGLTGNTQIGTLTVTIPASATSLSAYAVHFNKASGSPNGLAVFPKQTLTGLITLSSRTSSSYADGIPDTWRLRWFGTANNILSCSNACPSGDGISNWKKFVAGVDPNVANNFPSVHAKSPVPIGYNRSIHWPTVSGKQYVIERSTSLFPGDWTIIQTNTGTGTDMEFDDNVKGNAHFYRVRILP